MDAYAARNIINTKVALVDLPSWKESLSEVITNLENDYKLFSDLSMTGFRAIDKAVLNDVEGAMRAKNWDDYKALLTSASSKLHRFMQARSDGLTTSNGRYEMLSEEKYNALLNTVIGK